MSSWFDQLDGSDQIDQSQQPLSADSSGGALVRMCMRMCMQKFFVIPVVVLLVLSVTFGVLGVLLSTDQSEINATAVSSPTTVEVVHRDPDAQVAVAGQCEPEENEVVLSTGDATLRGTVAKWQKAYYAQDTTLTDYLTESSWMHEQDWAAILPEAAPAGSSWCAVMAPVKGDRVDVDVLVTFSDGSSQTYQQTVVGGQSATGQWLIDDIVTR